MVKILHYDRNRFTVFKNNEILDYGMLLQVVARCKSWDTLVPLENNVTVSDVISHFLVERLIYYDKVIERDMKSVVNKDDLSGYTYDMNLFRSIITTLLKKFGEVQGYEIHNLLHTYFFRYYGASKLGQKALIERETKIALPIVSEMESLFLQATALQKQERTILETVKKIMRVRDKIDFKIKASHRKNALIKLYEVWRDEIYNQESAKINKHAEELQKMQESLSSVKSLITNTKDFGLVVSAMKTLANLALQFHEATFQRRGLRAIDEATVREHTGGPGDEGVMTRSKRKRKDEADAEEERQVKRQRRIGYALLTALSVIMTPIGIIEPLINLSNQPIMPPPSLIRFPEYNPNAEGMPLKRMKPDDQPTPSPVEERGYTNLTIADETYDVPLEGMIVDEVEVPIANTSMTCAVEMDVDSFTDMTQYEFTELLFDEALRFVDPLEASGIIPELLQLPDDALEEMDVEARDIACKATNDIADLFEADMEHIEERCSLDAVESMDVETNRDEEEARAQSRDQDFDIHFGRLISSILISGVLVTESERRIREGKDFKPRDSAGRADDLRQRLLSTRRAFRERTMRGLSSSASTIITTLEAARILQEARESSPIPQRPGNPRASQQVVRRPVERQNVYPETLIKPVKMPILFIRRKPKPPVVDKRPEEDTLDETIRRIIDEIKRNNISDLLFKRPSRPNLKFTLPVTNKSKVSATIPPPPGLGNAPLIKPPPGMGFTGGEDSSIPTIPESEPSKTSPPPPPPVPPVPPVLPEEEAPVDPVSRKSLIGKFFDLVPIMFPVDMSFLFQKIPARFRRGQEKATISDPEDDTPPPLPPNKPVPPKNPVPPSDPVPPKKPVSPKKPVPPKRPPSKKTPSSSGPSSGSGGGSGPPPSGGGGGGGGGSGGSGPPPGGGNSSTTNDPKKPSDLSQKDLWYYFFMVLESSPEHLKKSDTDVMNKMVDLNKKFQEDFAKINIMHQKLIKRIKEITVYIDNKDNFINFEHWLQSTFLVQMNHVITRSIHLVSQKKTITF